MKTLKIASGLVLALGLAACQPQDNEVVSKDQRASILSRNRRGGNSSQNQKGDFKPQVQLGAFGLSAFMMEKQGEVLQLLAAAKMSQGQNLGALTLLESSSADQEIQNLVVGSQDFKMKVAEFNLNQNSLWDVFVFRKNADKTVSGISAYLKADAIHEVVEADKDEKSAQAVRLTESTASLSVKAESAESKAVSFTAQGSMVISKAGIVETLPYKINVEMKVATADFKEEILKITKSKVTLNLTRAGGSAMDVVIENRGDITFANSACPLVLGSATIVTDKKQKPVVFTTDKASVEGSQYSTKHAECGQRPVVDLRRVLVY